MSGLPERLSDELVEQFAADRWYNALTQEYEPTAPALACAEVAASRRAAKALREFCSLHRITEYGTTQYTMEPYHHCTCGSTNCPAAELGESVLSLLNEEGL